MPTAYSYFISILVSMLCCSVSLAEKKCTLLELESGPSVEALLSKHQITTVSPFSCQQQTLSDKYRFAPDIAAMGPETAHIYLASQKVGLNPSKFAEKRVTRLRADIGNGKLAGNSSCAMRVEILVFENELVGAWLSATGGTKDPCSTLAPGIFSLLDWVKLDNNLTQRR